MINVIICILTNAFRVFLIKKFIKIFMGQIEINAKKENWGYVLFFIQNTVLYFAFHLPVVNFLSNLIGIFLLVLLYTKSIKVNLFITSSIYILNIICDFISVFPFAGYEIGEEFNQFFEILTIFFLFVCELIVEKIISYRKGIVTIQNIHLILVPICSILVICFVAFGRNDEIVKIVVVSLGLLVVNFLVFYLYNFIIRSSYKKYENELLQREVQSYSYQLNTIMQSNAQIKALRHDMKHHMNEIKILAMKGDSHGIQKYIDEMQKYVQNPNEIVSSGNKEMDSLLNYMLYRAKNTLKEVDADIDIPENWEPSFDINIVIGNLLENSIEAAEKTDEKIMNLKIQLKQGILKIKVSNSFSYVLNENNIFLTTKRNKMWHGIGLGNVKRIVEKYRGTMDISHQNNFFIINIVLYI